ncbi:hypothetical protein [Verrucomicrobium spinosum]|uniref:hypothetical protein n=1 Tax=Verrucomicrobium spinosum TaxID=2736 RepID=UPI000B33487B
MQYTCLIYLDEKKFYALSKDEQNQIHKECGQWHEELVKAGKSLVAPLYSPARPPAPFACRMGKSS